MATDVNVLKKLFFIPDASDQTNKTEPIIQGTTLQPRLMFENLTAQTLDRVEKDSWAKTHFICQECQRRKKALNIETWVSLNLPINIQELMLNIFAQNIIRIESYHKQNTVDENEPGSLNSRNVFKEHFYFRNAS